MLVIFNNLYWLLAVTPSISTELVVKTHAHKSWRHFSSQLPNTEKKMENERNQTRREAAESKATAKMNEMEKEKVGWRKGGQWGKINRKQKERKRRKREVKDTGGEKATWTTKESEREVETARERQRAKRGERNFNYHSINISAINSGIG